MEIGRRIVWQREMLPPRITCHTGLRDRVASLVFSSLATLLGSTLGTLPLGGLGTLGGLLLLGHPLRSSQATLPLLCEQTRQTRASCLKRPGR